jgi:hypothetical protein
MAFETVTNYVEPLAKLLEWTCARLLLENPVSCALAGAAAEGASSLNAGTFSAAPPESGALALFSPDGERDTPLYSAFEGSGGTGAFTLGAALENSYEAGTVFYAGTALRTDWSVFVFNGVSNKDLFAAVPELTPPALVVSAGAGLYGNNPRRTTEINVLAVAPYSPLPSKGVGAVSLLVDRVVSLLDHESCGDALFTAMKHIPAETDGEGISAFAVVFSARDH